MPTTIPAWIIAVRSAIGASRATVVAIDARGDAVGIDTRSGKLRWRRHVGADGIDAAISRVRSGLLMLVQPSAVDIVAADTGTAVTHIAGAREVSGVDSDGSIAVVTTAGDVTAYALPTGRVLWRNAGPLMSLPQVAADRVFVSRGDAASAISTVMTLDRQTGRVRGAGVHARSFVEPDPILVLMRPPVMVENELLTTSDAHGITEYRAAARSHDRQLDGAPCFTRDQVILTGADASFYRRGVPDPVGVVTYDDGLRPIGCLGAAVVAPDRRGLSVTSIDVNGRKHSVTATVDFHNATLQRTHGGNAAAAFASTEGVFVAARNDAASYVRVRITCSRAERVDDDGRVVACTGDAPPPAEPRTYMPVTLVGIHRAEARP